MMKKWILSLVVLTLISTVLHAAEPGNNSQIPNRKIDYPGFLEGAAEVAKLRSERRLTELEFLKMAEQPGVIILDARSTEKYRMLHLQNAVNLSLPDMTEGELAKIIPTKHTPVLIYCNNNFEKEERAFPGKMARASLNIYTFNTLHAYGYTQVYELGPLIDIKKSILPFVKESR